MKCDYQRGTLIKYPWTLTQVLIKGTDSEIEVIETLGVEEN